MTSDDKARQAARAFVSDDYGLRRIRSFTDEQFPVEPREEMIAGRSAVTIPILLEALSGDIAPGKKFAILDLLRYMRALRKATLRDQVDYYVEFYERAKYTEKFCSEELRTQYVRELRAIHPECLARLRELKAKPAQEVKRFVVLGSDEEYLRSVAQQILDRL